jgi:uncharacterized protein (TIGR02246 family)
MPPLRRRDLALLALGVSGSAGLAGEAKAAPCALAPGWDASWSAEDQAIRALIGEMQAAWNRGDFAGYMAGFANPDVVFVSRGRIRTGWRDVLDHYRRDYGGDPARRGTLAFSEITITPLAPDAAQLISHYRLVREVGGQDGINTRLMRKREGRWVIALNHVSSIEEGACTPGARTG